MKKLFLFLVLGIAPAFVQPAAAQIVAVPPCVPTTTCLLGTDNNFTGKNQFAQGAAMGPVTISHLPTSPITGTKITVSDPSSASDCSFGGGNGVNFPAHECYWNGIAWILAGGGFICGTTPTPGVPYWDGTQCVIDGGASFDPVNIQWNFEALVITGTITGNKLATSGPGGILEMKAQSAPTPLANLFDLYIDVATGLVGCRNSSSGNCLGAVQFVVSGSTTLPATLVTANGGCNVYSSTATGATSSNGAYTSLHGVDSSAVSGYGPGQLLVYPPFVGTNLISFKVCNPTTSNITPASLTVFWDIK
jgi:hypothetical protein